MSCSSIAIIMLYELLDQKTFWKVPLIAGLILASGMPHLVIYNSTGPWAQGEKAQPQRSISIWNAIYVTIAIWMC